MDRKQENERAKEQARAQLESIVEMVKALDTENEEEREEAIQAIVEDPLEISVREGWHGIGEEATPEEFLILLCTGGPAVRIIGELDRYGHPENPCIQYHDWFTSWETLFDLTDEELEAIQAYCEQFYFES